MIVAIIGQIGSGKTVLNDALVRGFHRTHPTMEVVSVRQDDLGTQGKSLPGTRFYNGFEALDYLEKERALNFVLSVSEGQDVFGSRADRYDPRGFDLIFKGRHIGASLIVDTQRASRVTTDLLSQAHEIFSFRQILPHDLERVEEYAAWPEAPDVVRTLPDHVFASLRHPGKLYRLQF